MVRINSGGGTIHNQILPIRYSYTNNIEFFNFNRLNDIVLPVSHYEVREKQLYKKLLHMYDTTPGIDGVVDSAASLDRLNYSERIYPRKQNTFLSGTRSRTQFEVEYWRDLAVGIGAHRDLTTYAAGPGYYGLLGPTHGLGVDQDFFDQPIPNLNTRLRFEVSNSQGMVISTGSVDNPRLHGCASIWPLDARAGAACASAVFQADDALLDDDGTELILTNTDGTSVTFTTDDSKDADESTATLIGTQDANNAAGLGSGKATAALYYAFRAAIDAGTLKMTLSSVTLGNSTAMKLVDASGNADGTMRLTQTIPGASGASSATIPANVRINGGQPGVDGAFTFDNDVMLVRPQYWKSGSHLDNSWNGHGGYDGAGELQNDYCQFHMGSSTGSWSRFQNVLGWSTTPTAFGMPSSSVQAPQTTTTTTKRGLRAGAQYSRRVIEVINQAAVGTLPGNATSSILAGDTKWEAGEQRQLLGNSIVSGAFYNNYEEYSRELRVAAKDCTIVPEYRVSEHLPTYINNNSFYNNNPGWLTLTGATIPDSSNSEFYKVYSNTDFFKMFKVILNDHAGGIIENNYGVPQSIQLRCQAYMKFLPYDGFYPALRSLQLATLFSQSYGDTMIMTGSSAHYRTALQPFFAPGILYNTIKSGLAVDYPIMTGSFTRHNTYDTMHPAITGSSSGGFAHAAGVAYIKFKSIVTADKTIKIVSTDGTTKTYTCKNAENLTEGYFEGRSSATNTANSLQDCIEAAQYGTTKGGHDGKITVVQDGAVLTLTQADLGPGGNTEIITDIASSEIEISNRIPFGLNIAGFASGSHDPGGPPAISGAFGHRIPFEAILDPAAALDSVTIVDAEPHHSASIDSTASFGLAKNPLYSMAMHNFLAETVDFFLEGSQLTTFISQPDKNNGQFFNVEPISPASPNAKEYRMRVVCSSGESFGSPETMKSAQQAASTFESPFLVKTPRQWNPPSLVMYERTGTLNNADMEQHKGIAKGYVYGSSFGPRYKFTMMNNFVSPIYANSKPQTGSYAPFTPPYYNSYSHTELIFKPQRLGYHTLSEVFENTYYQDLRIIDYFNAQQREGNGSDGKGKLYWANDSGESGDNTSDSNQAMQLTASINLFQSVEQPATAYDPTGAPQLIDEAQSFHRWAIQTKFETPVLQFKNANVTLPTYGSGSVARGMWHQYGTLPTADEGIYLTLRDVPLGGLGSPDTTGSLIDLCGFTTSKQKIGRIKESKTVSEAIVAIPFRTTNKGIKVFYHINKSLALQAAGLKLPSSGEATPSTSLTRMADLMKKYVIPPRFDWITAHTHDIKDVDPVSMFIFPFEHQFNQKDLQDIWQNLPPDSLMTIKEPKSSFVVLSNDIAPNELMGNIPPGGPDTIVDSNFSNVSPAHQNLGRPPTQWLVFKIKKKANGNYYSKTISSADDSRFRFHFNFGQSGQLQSVPAWTYNWPYDYFSMIELAKIDGTFKFKGKP